MHVEASVESLRFLQEPSQGRPSFRVLVGVLIINRIMHDIVSLRICRLEARNRETHLINRMKIVLEVIMIPLHHIRQVVPFLLLPVRQFGIGLCTTRDDWFSSPAHVVKYV